MADITHNALAKENTQHEPQIITGHDPADYLSGITVKVHIYADKTAQKTSADGDEGSRNQQGNKRFNGFDQYSPAASFTYFALLVHGYGNAIPNYHYPTKNYNGGALEIEPRR
jgi:hypothetical protein